MLERGELVRVQGSHHRTDDSPATARTRHLNYPPPSKTCIQSKMDFDPSTIVKKRLHVAGLTSAASASDLIQRLRTFGTVITVGGRYSTGATAPAPERTAAFAAAERANAKAKLKDLFAPQEEQEFPPHRILSTESTRPRPGTRG